MPQEEVVVSDGVDVEGAAEEVVRQIIETTAMTIVTVALEEEGVVVGLYGGPHEVLLLPLEGGGVEDLRLRLLPRQDLLLQHSIGI